MTTTAFAQEEESNTTAGETTTTTSDTSTTTTPSSGLELSPQPVWQERVTTTRVTQINETHSIVEFVGNGTLTLPDIGETINMTNNGTAIISPVAGSVGTVSAYGREYVFSEDNDDSTAITFYEIVQYDPATFQGKGLTMAVFDTNATGSLILFDGLMVAGTHDEQPNAEGITTNTTITLWEWESGIGKNSVVPPTLDFMLRLPPLQEESSMSTTTKTATPELPPPTNAP
jgi:C4-type Zn-finger protein